MCFAPQRCALFRHLNFQKWSEHGVLCTFWLRNVLRATTACNFSSLIWPDGSAPAALASLFSDPPEPQIIGKTQCFATFLPFRASASSFFWLFLFSDLLSSTLLFSLTLSISAFHLSILSEVWLLNFLRLYIYIYTHKDNYLSGYLLGKSEYGIYHGWYDFGILNIRPKNTRRCVTGPTVWFKHTKIWILLHGLCLNFQYLSDSSDCELSASKKSKSSMATYNGWKKSCISWQVVVSQYLCFFKGLNYPR